MISQTPASTETSASIKRKVFLVDDHPIFRLGLATLINQEPDLEVCGQATNMQQALEGLRQIFAHAAVLDVSLPGTNGLELLKNVRAEHPQLPVLVLSAHDESTYAMRCLRAGASGYLMKFDTERRLLDALRKILSGEVYVSPAFGEQLIFKVAGNVAHKSASPLEALSDRELEILQLVGNAKSSRVIAEELHLSVKTVESHRLHIKEKLALEDAGKLVRFAMDWVSTQAL